jgi:hypothetical protein
VNYGLIVADQQQTLCYTWSVAAGAIPEVSVAFRSYLSEADCSEAFLLPFPRPGLGDKDTGIGLYFCMAHQDAR